MTNNDKTRIEAPHEDTIQCSFFSAAIGFDILREDLCKQLNRLIQTLSIEHIWHRDEFQIYIPIEDTETEVPHLSSTTCFGDNIEDEWFIVHLIFELTKNYKNLIVQVKDNDGDFLLIEAADYLPSWANPDTTENRVFIHNKHIHIIPVEMASLQSKLEMKEALQMIIQSPEQTQASTNIEMAILNRIGKYPQKDFENIYKNVAKLPRTLATLLTLKPSLIAPIVESYCNHDVMDAKCCKNINFDDCVTIEVKFTKFLYAMLAHSKLIPYVKHHAGLESDKKSILGLKLLCGFQMITNRSASMDLFATKEYIQFLNSLKHNGYFKNNTEGSKDYNELLNKAKDYFTTVECPLSSHISHKILEIISSDEFIALKDKLVGIQMEHSNNSEDNEDWLNIKPDQLNELLHTRYGKRSNLNNNDVISPEAITTELSHFLKQTADIEGIEPVRAENLEINEIDFEPDNFVASLEKMLSICAGNKQDTGCDFSNSSEDDSEDMLSDDDCDKELKNKLQGDHKENLQGSKAIINNIIQSMKEEKASTGPSSNLLRSLGIGKSDLLDSDDDLS